MYGLVLAGGGGKGGYHIGVWKALIELNIEISAVTGTSVGSLNGAFVAQGDYDLAVNLWSSLTADQVLNISHGYYKELLSLSKNPTPTTIAKSLKTLETLYRKGGLDISPLQEMIRSNLDEDKIRRSKIAFGLVTVSLTDKKPLELFIEDIPVGKLADYLLASSFLPGFISMELDGKRFIDGGFYDNLPINLMTKKGITNIIAVDLKSIGRKRPAKNSQLNVIEISPSGEIASLIEFDYKQSLHDMRMGYLDTLKAFNQYQGFLYYLTDLPTSIEVIHFISAIPLAYLEPLFNILKCRVPLTKRMVFETLLPTLAPLFNVTPEDSYPMLLVKILEYMASEYSIYRLQTYTYREFLSKILDAMDQNPDYTGSNDTFEALKEKLGISLPKYQVAHLILSQYKTLYGHGKI